MEMEMKQNIPQIMELLLAGQDEKPETCHIEAYGR
jgi:hypothetical protein